MTAPAFAITPEQDKLATVERDLRFHPSPVIDPKTLTLEQVAAFNRGGYLAGIRVFSTAEAEHRAILR